MKKLISKYQLGSSFLPTYKYEYEWKKSPYIPEVDKKSILEELDKENNNPVRPPLVTKARQQLVNRENNLQYRYKQQSLKKLGLYNKGIDGIWGSGSKKAEAAALEKGYFWDQNTKSYIMRPLDNSLSDSSIVSVNGDLNQFGLYAYQLGTTGLVNNIGNIVTTTYPMLKALFRNESPVTYHNTGTDLQIIGVAYGGGKRPLDADLRLLRGETIRYSIGKDKDGNYDWRSVNGGRDVADSGGLAKLASESGSHTIGQAVIEESPEGIRVIDNYDFNNRGVSGLRVDNGTANAYDYVRAAMPNKVDNPEYKGLAVDWFISRDLINKLINGFNNR